MIGNHTRKALIWVSAKDLQLKGLEIFGKTKQEGS
jgi:hypothetical protein